MFVTCYYCLSQHLWPKFVIFSGMVNAKAKQFTRDELKKALKDFKSNKDDVQDQKVTSDFSVIIGCSEM